MTFVRTVKLRWKDPTPTVVRIVIHKDRRKGPQTLKYDISPTDAMSALEECNVKNRPADDRIIKSYAQDMKDGEWTRNPQPFIFDWHGRLWSGQKRLWAIYLSGVTLRDQLVVTNMDPNECRDIDTGQKKTYGHLLSMREETNTVLLAAAVRRVHLWELGSRTTTDKSSGISNRTLDMTLEKHPEIRDATAAASRIKQNKVRLPPAVIALTWWVFGQLSANDRPEDRDGFFDRLITGANMDADHPIMRLREKLGDLYVPKKGQPRGRPADTLVLGLTCKAWNAYRDGNLSVRTLSYIPGGEHPDKFPEPH